MDGGISHVEMASEQSVYDVGHHQLSEARG
jgi:hypothetical protein